VIAVSLDVDVDTNKELVAHGYSNLIGGLVGTVYVSLFSPFSSMYVLMT